MRSGLYMVLLAAMLLAISGAVCPGQVIKIDPNTPSASAPQEEPQDFWTDNRLEQKVNYEAKIKPVRDILDELTDLTGVKLNAGYNFNDWQVRDRRMVIIAKELPLEELMRSIARVMKFKWSRTEKDGVWTYRLVMDRKTLLGEEAQRYREEQRESEYIDKQREKLVDTMEKSSQYTDEDLAEMKESDPYSYALVKSGVGAAMGDLIKAAPEVRQAVRSGERLQIDTEGLSADAQGALVRLAQASKKMEFYQIDDESRAVLADASSHPENLYIWLNYSDEVFEPGDPRRQLMLGSMQISYRNPPDSGGVMMSSRCSSMEFLDSGSSIGRFYGQMASRAIDGDAPIETVLTEFGSQIPQVVSASQTTTDWGEAPVEHPEDPDLERVVKMELPKIRTPEGQEQECRRYEDILGTVAEAADFSVVSDYFNPLDFRTHLMGTWEPEARIIDALSYIEQSFVCNWWKQDRVIELRDRYWFRKRAMQVPDAWMARWMGELDKTGFIEIDNLSQICNLTPEQFLYNFPDPNRIDNLDWLYHQKDSNAMLRFCGSLSRFQKETLLQGSLDKRALSEAQLGKLGQVDSKLQLDKLVSISGKRDVYPVPDIDENGKEFSRNAVSYGFYWLAGEGGTLLEVSVPLPMKREKD